LTAVSTEALPPAAISQKYDALVQRTRALEQDHVKEIGIAFSSGFLFFVACLLAMRAVTAARAGSRDPQYTRAAMTAVTPEESLLNPNGGAFVPGVAATSGPAYVQLTTVA
jgi:hypothetical protein